MIRRATEQEIDDWNNLVSSNPDGGHLYQSKQWAQFKESGGWDPIYCVYEAAGRVVAFVLLKKPVSILGNIYYCSKGPGFFRDFKTDHDSKAHFMEFMVDLKSFISKEDRSTILVKVEPQLELGQDIDLKTIGLIKSKSDWQYSSTILVDISKPEDELLASLKQKTRYNIRLAERKGVKVEAREINDSNIELMYELMQETRKRGGYFLRPKEYFAEYWKLFSHAGNGQLLIASHDGDTLGGVFAAVAGEYGYYKDGGSFDTKRNLMAPYLLQWEAIKWAKSKQASKYDMVSSPSNADIKDESHLQHGLYQFKRSFSEEITDFVGCWDLPIHQQKYNVWVKQEHNFLRLYAKMKKNLFW